MLPYGVTIRPLNQAPVPASPVNGAVELPFFGAGREAKAQFAPHRLLRNYAEYRRLNAGAKSLFDR
ncbi:MAG: hypothetical protein ACLPIC_17650 [Rhodoblastus sp.]|uniref:hypothetical protein n=1 Tax=Rhodoblastus sp. TaxID=1962975 RepID=UPI003F95BFE9